MHSKYRSEGSPYCKDGAWSPADVAMSRRYDEAEVREYFPLPTVLDGLYRLCNRLFGITVKVA